MSIEQYIKGSVWTTGKPMRVRGVDLPAGTTFEVMYPRRRESDLVAVKFRGVDFSRRRENGAGSHSIRSRTRKGRFHKADEFLSTTRLDGSQLVSLPDTPLEFFIRDRTTGHLWQGGRFISPGFHPVGFTEANHYATMENALTGCVTIMFKQWRRVRNRVKEGEPIWEIVGYDPFGGVEVEVTEIGVEWWNTILRIARYARDLPEDIQARDGISALARKMRKLANLVRLDSGEWGYVALLDQRLPPAVVKKKWAEKMSTAGITEVLSADDNTFLLAHDTDRVMMKLLFADEVETHSLV